MRNRRSVTARQAFMKWCRKRPAQGSRSTPRTACIVRPAISKIRRRTSIGKRQKAAVARITPICEALLRNLLLSTVAGFSILLNGGAFAATHDDGGNALGPYLAARSAASQHNMGEASRLYLETLDSNPDDTGIANRAFLYTAAAGDVG